MAPLLDCKANSRAAWPCLVYTTGPGLLPLATHNNGLTPSITRHTHTKYTSTSLTLTEFSYLRFSELISSINAFTRASFDATSVASLQTQQVASNSHTPANLVHVVWAAHLYLVCHDFDSAVACERSPSNFLIKFSLFCNSKCNTSSELSNHKKRTKVLGLVHATFRDRNYLYHLAPKKC